MAVILIPMNNPLTKKIIIFGASGQLGVELTKNTIHTVYSYAQADLDLTVVSVNELVNLLELHQANVVINAAAYTAVDKAEYEIAAAYAMNAYAVRKMARACAITGVRLIHISTDYVFDGQSSVPYTTQADIHPLNIYGASKALGEALLFQFNPDAVCLRTAWLYSMQGNNFVNTMLRLMAKSKSIRVVNDQWGSPTWAHDVAECIWRIVALPEVKGILHWTSAGHCSWYEFAQAIQERAVAKGLLKSACKLVSIPASEYPVAAQRPDYSVLDCEETVAKLQHTPRDWRIALDAMLDELVLQNSEA